MSSNAIMLGQSRHHKHSLRSYPEIMTEFRAMFPEIKGMLNSTAVTYVNGYLGGNGSYDALKKEIESFELSLTAKEILTYAVCITATTRTFSLLAW